MSRLFFGVEIPAEVKEMLEDAQGTLQSNGVIANNWSDPQLFHITVLFLGEMHDGDVPTITKCADRAAAQVPPFTLTFSEIGTFPQNKILWMGIKRDVGMHTLERLHHAVSEEIVATGLVRLETRPYRAHITLARKLDVGTVALSAIPKTTVERAGSSRSFEVTHLALFESKRVAGRLVYPVVAKYPLTGTMEAPL